MARTSIKNLFRLSYTLAGLLVVAAVSCLPQSVTWMIGAALGWLFSIFPSPARRVVARNIELCFSELSPDARRRRVRRHLRMCGVAILSMGAAWWAPKERVRSLVRTRGQHHLDQAIAGGRNVILLAPHFIALDICGVRVSLDRQFVTMFRRSKNALLDRLSRRRARFGIVLLEREASLKPLIQHIRKGMPFYYLPDLDAGDRAGVFVPFFGIPASTVTALGRIAQATQAVVVPCISRILPAGLGYEVRFLAPLENFPTADPTADARRMNQEIEGWIREIPDQYMWANRRFKTRPNGEPSVYRTS